MAESGRTRDYRLGRVEPTNPALRLYRRLGYQRVSVSGESWTMRRDLR